MMLRETACDTDQYGAVSVYRYDAENRISKINVLGNASRYEELLSQHRRIYTRTLLHGEATVTPSARCLELATVRICQKVLIKPNRT